MRGGMELSDEDRAPWLEALCDATREHVSSGGAVVVACSALKRKYREILRNADTRYKPGSYSNCRVRFACLEAPAEVIAARMERRIKDDPEHFMPTSLLKSQLDLLQIDDDEEITRFDATPSLQSVVSIIRANLDTDATA